jgi:hypothetical protein
MLLTKSLVVFVKWNSIFIELNAKIMICPYCNLEVLVPSRDHIFSKFLFGKETIAACKGCNDLFGHSFEGKVSDDLKPITTVLAFCGVKSPRTVIWKKGLSYNGDEYNLDTEGNLTGETKILHKDERTTTVRFGSREIVEKNIKSLKGKGRSFNIVESQSRIRPDFNISIPMTLAIRRLATKMCVALSQVFHQVSVIDENTRDYLMTGETLGSLPEIGYIFYDALDILRPPLAHTIYVEGDAIAKLCYGVVQFYGTFQIYCILNENYDGPDFAYIGTHDVINQEEKFKQIEPLQLVAPMLHCDPIVFENCFAKMVAKLFDQVTVVTGKSRLEVSQLFISDYRHFDKKENVNGKRLLINIIIITISAVAFLYLLWLMS